MPEKSSMAQFKPSPDERRRHSRLWRLLADAGRRRRLIMAGAALALLLVAGLSVLARLYTVLPLDVWFTRELQERQFELVSRLMAGVSWFGYAPWSALTVAAGVIVVGVLLSWRDGLYLLAITVAQGLVNAGIKAAIGRPRPLGSLVEVLSPAQGFSFPSGHVMFYSVFFGFLLFLALTRIAHTLWRRLVALPLTALIALVGPSRILLGAHWLSDVVAAYLLGLVLLVAAIEVHLRLSARPHR